MAQTNYEQYLEAEVLHADPVKLVSAWAEKGSIPPDLDLLAALGGSDGR